MKDILKMARIQIAVIILFVFFKWIRPSVMIREGNELFKLFLLSFPNLCEAIIGVLTLTGIGIYLNKNFKIGDKLIYIIATLLAAIYITTQELKIHNLGGDNIYDPNDLFFSAIGLFIGAIIVFCLNPKIKVTSTKTL